MPGMLQDFSEKMGNKKLLNSGSSPPIAYKRYSNNCEELKPLQQKQQQSYQQQQQQHTGKSRQNNNVNNTCLLVKHNTTNTMFTKFKKYFTQFRTTSTSASASTSHKQYSQQQRKRYQHQHYRHEKLTECNSIPIVQSTSNMLSIVSIVVTLVFLASINGVTSSPVFVDNPSLAQFQSGRNIRHLPCIVRKSGRSGVCMFAIDCIKQNGTHLGTCIDRFYFGSCCDIKEEELAEIADNSIDQNTISHHFTPESSTVLTSALFKLNTLSPLQQPDNISSTNSGSSSSSSSSSSGSSTTSTSSSTTTQQDVTQALNSVTQTFASTTLKNTPRPTTVLITSSNTVKPIKSTTTVKPAQQTTHKQSHFVIRTTAKPTKYTGAAKPSHNTTTKKKTTTASTTTRKSTTTTTTKQPILTTAEAIQHRDELPIEATTSPPAKLFTYQIVETTANTPTEATNMYEFVTTDRIQHRTTKPPQTTSSSVITTLAPKRTTTTAKETTVSTTEVATTHKITTVKSKPQTTRKATTTKKPTSIKRTTVKPTRRPITTTFSTTTRATSPSDLKTQLNTTTEMQKFSTNTTSPGSTTLENKTTLAPRPRPKPTASIIKVPKPAVTTTRTTTTSSTTTTTTTTTPRTTTEAEKIINTTSKKPLPATSSTTTTTTTSTTSTTPKTTATTTTHKVTYKPILTSTTHKPGLVTWTNIDGEPADPNQPEISDWVPVTSVAPPNTLNKVEDSTAENVTVEEMDVSVSSSVSAMMNNTTVIISPPQKPVLVTKPPPTTATTTTTTGSSFPTNAPEPTTTSLKPTSGANEQPESTTASESSSQFTTEGFTTTTSTSPSGFSTEEVTTESLNLNSTTALPNTGLEGVDYRQVCGRRMFPEPRIVGGSNAAFGRWPWQISLRQWRTSTYLHKCGAALLNENWAITAAHCVDNVPPSDLLLRLGEYDLAEEEEPYGYQERRVQIVASHPQFDPRTFEYDLALLRFYEPVVFQPNIIPVCVPENDENFIGQTAFVTGWGRLYEDGPLPSVLQEVAVPVINNTICESMYRAAGYIEHIPHIFICAGWKKGGYDSCEGDSGGPMVLQRESDKRFQLGGVISWGIGCAEANQPGVYTRISEFRDWINQILQF